MSQEQVKFCSLCDAVLGFRVDHCPKCGSYEGPVHLLEDRLQLPRRPRAALGLAWSARVLLAIAAIVVLCAVIASL